MSTPKAALLRQALQSVQMHAAGLHASADLALRLLADSEEIRDVATSGQGINAQTAGPRHYGDIESHLQDKERSGGSPPNPANGGDTSAQE